MNLREFADLSQVKEKISSKLREINSQMFVNCLALRNMIDGTVRSGEIEMKIKLKKEESDFLSKLLSDLTEFKVEHERTF